MAPITSVHPQSWWRRLIAPISAIWYHLTEAAPGVTDVRVRRQIRLNSVLTLSSFIGGILSFTAIHYGSAHNIDLRTNPVWEIFLICISLNGLAYFLGRNEKLLYAPPLLLITAIIVGEMLATMSNPGDFYPFMIYQVQVGIFASLLLPPAVTRVILVISLSVLLCYPLIIPAITLDMTLRVFGPLFVVSVMIAIGVTLRERDLRTIERQARQLDEARQQAESANKLKGVFLGMVSHELRTPLNNILGYSDQMLMGLTGDLPGEAIEAAERIHRNGENLSRMISDLLVLSRLESGSLTISRRPFHVHDLLAELDRSFRDRAEAKGLAFEIRLDEALPAVIVGDPQRIEQIVGNLVSNAVKFTDRGSITVRLGRRSPEEWTTEVIDTGIGMSEEAALRAFDRFYQVDSTSRRSHGGAGLGLAIARELAILMGGNISLKTVVRFGSAFTVTLPLTTDETDLPAVQTGSIITVA